MQSPNAEISRKRLEAFFEAFGAFRQGQKSLLGLFDRIRSYKKGMKNRIRAFRKDKKAFVLSLEYSDVEK